MIGGSYVEGALALTNIAAGTFTQELGATYFEYFNILTQTITNMTVTIEGTLDDVHWNPVTQDLFGVAALVSDDEYLADTYMTYKNLRIKYERTNATNALNLQWMVKKGGGR